MHTLDRNLGFSLFSSIFNAPITNKMPFSFHKTLVSLTTTTWFVFVCVMWFKAMEWSFRSIWMKKINFILLLISAHAHYFSICAPNEHCLSLCVCTQVNQNIEILRDELQRDKRAAKVYQSWNGGFIVCLHLKAWRIVAAAGAASPIHAAIDHGILYHVFW